MDLKRCRVYFDEKKKGHFDGGKKKGKSWIYLVNEKKKSGLIGWNNNKKSWGHFDGGKKGKKKVGHLKKQRKILGIF